MPNVLSLKEFFKILEKYIFERYKIQVFEMKMRVLEEQMKKDIFWVNVDKQLNLNFNFPNVGKT